MTQNEINLDEKIRRIREENKAREKRFKEIQADKIQALGSSLCIKDVGCFEKERCSENEQGIKRQMKGVSVASESRKMAKGRGQRLLEMSKETLKAKDFESKARESLKTLEEKPRKKCLKAKDFESMARWSLKTHEKNDLPSCSDIPSSGYINPLIDDRYLDKPKKQDISKKYFKGSDGNNAGFQSWNEKDAEIKGKGITTQKDKVRESYGQGQEDHTRPQEEALSSGWVSGKENVRQENISEDRIMEVMNLDESKMEPVIDAQLMVTDLPCNNLKADSCSHKEETDITLYEDAEIKDKNNAGLNECRKPQLDNIPEVCQSFTEHDVKNEKVPLNKETEEDIMFTELAAPAVLQNNALKEQETTSKDKISKTKSKENRPKVTLNTKLKKTLSNSSFEDGMSLLSPLDVPTNWGDLDYGIEASGGGAFYP